jgi:hypothetical protein
MQSTEQIHMRATIGQAGFTWMYFLRVIEKDWRPLRYESSCKAPVCRTAGWIAALYRPMEIRAMCRANAEQATDMQLAEKIRKNNETAQ